MNFKTINVQQGSKEWHEWRKSGLTATDMVKLKSCNYANQNRLINIKIGIEEDSTYINDAMINGHIGEQKVMDILQSKCFDITRSQCVQNMRYDFAIASLDGINIAEDYVIEVKSPYSDSSQYLKGCQIGSDAYTQIQWQLFVTGFSKARYIVWYKEQIYIDKYVLADSQYQTELLQLAQTIWNKITCSTSLNKQPNLFDIKLNELKSLENTLNTLESQRKALRSDLENLLINQKISKYSNETATVSLSKVQKVSSDIFPTIVRDCQLTNLYGDLTKKFSSITIDEKSIHKELLQHQIVKAKYDELASLYTTETSMLKITFSKGI
jgi:putative phage-type endonuclease